MDFILKLCLMFVLLQVVPSKSIRNNTDTDSKMDLMENSLENMEQRILNLTNQVTKLSKSKFFFFNVSFVLIPVSLKYYTKKFNFVVFLHKYMHENE